MNKRMDYKKYNNKFEYSYSFGAFTTINMIKYKSAVVTCVLLHSDLEENSMNTVVTLCKKYDIPYKENCDKIIEKIRNKENCNVIGIFKKYEENLDLVANHVVLVNPSDMGNIGTIIRTCLGFNIYNIAIIRPGVDIFNPKVIRASMGAIFQINFKYYDSFQEYKGSFKEHDFYPFMLDGAIDLKSFTRPLEKKYSLIFGNESSGLDSTFSNIGQSIVIKHNDKIDSLNLGVAVGVALNTFSN